MYQAARRDVFRALRGSDTVPCDARRGSSDREHSLAEGAILQTFVRSIWKAPFAHTNAAIFSSSVNGLAPAGSFYPDNHKVRGDSIHLHCEDTLCSLMIDVCPPPGKAIEQRAWLRWTFSRSISRATIVCLSLVMSLDRSSLFSRMAFCPDE